MAVIVITVLLVLAISATCSLFEAVIYSVSPAFVETLANKGTAAGRTLKRLRRDVDRPIAAILSLNTVANTAGATIAGAAVGQVFGAEAVAWFSAGLTLAILTLAEIVPKTAGVVYARRLAPLVALPLQVLVWLLTPLVWFSGLVTRLVAPGRSRGERVSDSELVVLARIAHRSGSIESGEAAVIQNILGLEDQCVGEIMTPRTVMLSFPANATVDEVHDHKRFYDFARVPIYDGDDAGEIVGVVQRPYVLRELAEDRHQTPLRDLMAPANFVRDDMPLDRLLPLFLEKRQHLFVVVGASGELAGVVSLEDVVEEILGQEIVDETDRVTDLRELARQRRAAAIRAADEHWPSRSAD